MSHSVISHDVARSEPAPAGSGPRKPAGSPWGFIRRNAGSIVVVAVLGGVAWWGHATDWTLPKFSALLGGDSSGDAEWCDAHGVPEGDCIECNVSLHPDAQDYAFCTMHGVPQCLFEHPDVAETPEPITITEADRERSARALALRPRQENNSRCKTQLRHVQFASHEAAEKAGVDVTVVERGPVVEAVVANGQLQYDETKIAHLSSQVMGSVASVRKREGDRVREGDVLVLIDSADVGRMKAEFVQAISHERLTAINLERLTSLVESGAVAERQLREAATSQQEAQIALHSARQALVNLGFEIPEDHFAGTPVEEITRRMQFLGLPSEITATLDRRRSTSNLYPLRAPIDGLIVNRDVVEGEVIDTTNSLFTVADVGQMWLILDVRQDDIELVKPGATVRFRASDRPNSPEARGTVSWISTSADHRTRTVKVRVDLPNDGQLRANTFGTGRIVLREESDTILVPSQAVHWDGCCQVVFVRDKHYFDEGAPKFYHVRKVRTGVKENGRTEILAGVYPGEVIASKGSSVLAAQLLRSNLGAGCACGH
jgi:cobalt-zinc-cadmium efflux system membrane fusion protein